MGLFSSIGKVLFGDPTKDIRRAAGVQQAGFQRGEEYLTGIDELPLELRNQALQQLQGFYSGDPGAQQGFIDTARASPFYKGLIAQGQEGVLGEAGRFGLTRSGNTTQDLNLSNQNVLRGLVSQNLQGLQGFTDPRLNTANIANMITGAAGAESGGITAAAQADQGLAGQVLGGITGGLSLAGNLGWNPFGGGGGSNALPGPAGSNISDYTGSAYQNWLGG